ncbi:MFS transporter [Glycomyces harbinensis]|uniref:Predicted arabinose efflux permease, MFS family n=1 Tax=Glycomyces harbinensis TaxID=58114 RepID=A0A1G6TQW8_9ACTN|nr:MFS transporter [Glycomyces harbinensis]SDD31503.1 Predicted arabinose efflux permease, MFS family [Glycomyces harbinensis]
MTEGEPTRPSILRQPTAVWAIAFACAVSFMGIGLVDPILPAISEDLRASPSQTMLLFTSYLLITAVAMFFSGFISSRLGVKRTLLAGLTLIVVFAALAGASDTVGQIIGFRAGWGLGNALFISTALAAIVGAASGGSRQAVVLYEAALGIGMAVGPLLGGALGEVSWRGPFFGTAALMAVGLAAVAVLLRGPVPKPAPVRFTAGLTALRDPALLTLALTALFYNYGFFTLLAYSPYPIEAAAAASGMDFGAHELGLIFFGWGTALAVTSVFVAPVLTRRFGLLPVLHSMFALLALSLATMAVGVASAPVLIVMVIAAGLFLGVLNTALTETVMEATDLPRGVASSTYSGVRFLGGAVAPAVSGGIAEAMGEGAPYWFGFGALLVSILVLALGKGTLAHLGRPRGTVEQEAQLITVGDEV